MQRSTYKELLIYRAWATGGSLRSLLMSGQIRQRLPLKEPATVISFCQVPSETEQILLGGILTVSTVWKGLARVSRHGTHDLRPV